VETTAKGAIKISFIDPADTRAAFKQQGDRTDFARSPIVSDIYEAIFLQAGSQLVNAANMKSTTDESFEAKLVTGAQQLPDSTAAF
jgi:hypothetical protein